ncbi:hypothetical protein ALC57_06588 [Trachymyrmex cornetzi]|uniref:Uncharacterized protein n=1 Tax=Trachymyrmex cornetzi TaxID=471704 RepID=A0A151J8A1_9HYME|nr:hypothetical protein ALC57_06588 [Trachymyrmex cornetzi]
MAVAILEIANQICPNMHFPTYNSTGYTGIANQICPNMHFPTEHLSDCFTLYISTMNKPTDQFSHGERNPGGGVVNIEKNTLYERAKEITDETASQGLLNPFDSDCIDENIHNKQNIVHTLEENNENDPVVFSVGDNENDSAVFLARYVNMQTLQKFHIL